MDQGFQKCRNSCVSSFVFQWQSFYHDFFYSGSSKSECAERKEKRLWKIIEKAKSERRGTTFQRIFVGFRQIQAEEIEPV